MVAALHWFDADKRVFRNFLSWRSGFNRNSINNNYNNSSLATTSSTDKDTAVDLFKQQLINFAESIVEIQIDQIEAAIVNVLLILATGKNCHFHKGSVSETTCGETTLNTFIFFAKAAFITQFMKMSGAR